MVPSHPKYGKALRPLLESMYVSGVDMDEILVVLNDCEEGDVLRGYDVLSGVRYVTIRNNIYEYGAHVGTMKAVRDGLVPRTNDFVMLHDTCIAGKNFKATCLELQGSSEAQIIWATAADNDWHSGGAFNIGLYRYEAVEYINKILCDMMEMEKQFAIQMELKKNYISIKNAPLHQHFSQQKLSRVGKFDIYEEKRKRDAVHITSMDLFKFFFWVSHGDLHPNAIS